MTSDRSVSHHLMYTPKIAHRRVGGDASTGRKLTALSPTAGFSSADVVDALVYYFDNAFNTELPPQSTAASRRVQWETSSMWKLMIEIFRMEALNERLHEAGFTSVNPIRDGFMKYKEFRRLMAMIRWCHWVNSEEAEPSLLNDITNSAAAYPMTGDSVGIDQPLTDSKSINHSDLKREKHLCRNLWIYLTQGRIADAIDLCTSSGHHWRAGVLNAACGHEFMGDSALEDIHDIQPDWVECEIISELFTGPSQSEEVTNTRIHVKKIARQILEKSSSSLDEFDTAINAYIAGNEDGMRRVTDDTSLTLWAGLHAIKEQFVSCIILGDESEGNMFGTTESSNANAALQSAIEGLIITLNDMMELESLNQLKALQLAFARGDYIQCIDMCYDWINDGIIKLDHVSVDIDLSSPTVDGTATVLVRNFACSFANLIENLVGKKKLIHENSIDIGKINTIVVGNIECLIAQFKASPGGLIEGNAVIVDNLNLLRSEPESDVQTKTWAWYVRQYTHETNGLENLHPDRILGFTPLTSLLETAPNKAIEVVRLLLADVVMKKSEFVLSHALGASVEAGHDIGFAVCLANGLWLLAQSGAKSTGAGIYSEMVHKDDPEEAAAEIVADVSNMIGEGLGLLVLADFQLTRAIVNLTMNQLPSRLVSIHCAMDAIQEEESNVPDTCGVMVSIVKILDRVTGLMDRNSLLEQQRTNMARLSKAGGIGTGTVAVSTDTRRQIIDTQRLIDTTSEMVVKMSDDIIAGVSEVLKGNECPIDLTKSVSGIDEDVWTKIVTALIDVLLESSVQAVALVDDRRRQETLHNSIKTNAWVPSILGNKRVAEILEEIA